MTNGVQFCDHCWPAGGGFRALAGALVGIVLYAVFVGGGAAVVRAAVMGAGGEEIGGHEQIGLPNSIN